jgi:hypothetical protein
MIFDNVVKIYSLPNLKKLNENTFPDIVLSITPL